MNKGKTRGKGNKRRIPLVIPVRYPLGIMKNPPKKDGRCFEMPQKAEENLLLIPCPPNTLHKCHAHFLGDE
jgi:hypothetical protein